MTLTPQPVSLGHMTTEIPHEQTRMEAFQTIAQLYTYVFDLPAVLRRQKPVSALVGLAELGGLVASIGVSIVALDQYNLVVGRLASTIYLRDLAQFKRQIVQGAVCGFLYSIGIMLSKALYQRISALWRNALTRLVQTRYVRSAAFYLQRPGAAGHNISDPDQRIVEDIQRTSTMMAAAFYKSVSTTSNAIQAIVRLSFSVNPRYVLFSIGYLWVTQKLRETMVPAMRLSRLNAATSKATGEFASALRRLHSSCEPIVALGGTSGEKRRMLKAYNRVKEMQRDTLTSTTKDTYIWYSAPTTTLQPLFMQLLVEIPFVLASSRGVTSAFNQIDARRGMAANAQVLGQMTLVTTLVSRMMGQVRALMIMPRQLLGVAGAGGRVVDLLNACHSLGSKATDSNERVDLRTEDMRPSIALEGLTVHSPAGDVLVRDLTFEIKPGRNLLIVGANGVGKTSIFRAMRGLWPKEGSATLPRQVCDGGDRPELMFLPQVPYCPRGTLADVLTYPHPVGKLGASVTKVSMRSSLAVVDLEYLLEGFPAVVGSDANGCENLSLGERQRLSVARLLYHRPVFAVPAPLN